MTTYSSIQSGKSLSPSRNLLWNPSSTIMGSFQNNNIDTTAGGSTPQSVDLSNYVALISHPSAVGTVKLMDLAVESEYDIRRQGTLMVAKMAIGSGFLRPEACVEIKIS